MKIKFVLTSFIVLFVIVKVVDAVASNELTVGDNSTEFCQYQGMLGDLAEVDREFKMLLELPNYPNFQSMHATVSWLLEQIRASEKHLEALRNPECNVAKYVKKLLTYYEANKEKIKKNTKNGSSGQDIITVFESLKKEVGTGFLSTMILDNLRGEVDIACRPTYDSKHDRWKVNGGTRCHNMAALTLMELINTVQTLNKELDLLKQQIALTSPPNTCEREL